MNENSNIFIGKKILIYGLGISGISSFKFLKRRNDVYVYDDDRNIELRDNIKKYFIQLKKKKKKDFDLIILSPGININRCKLSSFLKKNFKDIYTDLDIFYSFYSNLNYN